MALELADLGGQGATHQGQGGVLQGVGELDARFDQLVAGRKKFGQLDQGRVRHRARRWSEGATEGAEEAGIDGVGLGQLALGPGKEPNAGGVNDADGPAGLKAGLPQGPLVTAGGFDNEVALGGEIFKQERDGSGCIGLMQEAPRGVPIEEGFGDIDTDIG